MVAAFPEKAAAEQVQRDFYSGGYEATDCKLVTADQVIPVAQDQLQDAGWLARLGKADELLEEHLSAARSGSAFLVIYAPSDAEADRVMNVVRRVPFDFVHRYHRFAMQTMK